MLQRAPSCPCGEIITDVAATRTARCPPWHGNGNWLQKWEWEWEGMGIDYMGMGGSDVKSHSRSSLLPASTVYFHELSETRHGGKQSPRRC